MRDRGNCLSYVVPPLESENPLFLLLVNFQAFTSIEECRDTFSNAKLALVD